MAGLNDLLSWIDNKKRVVGRNLSDLVSNPSDAFPQLAENVGNNLVDQFQDPMNFVGGGIGRIKSGIGNTTYPTHAAMVGQMRSMNLINDPEAHRIINMGKSEGKAVDPELLGLIEDEIVRRGVQRRPINDLMDVRKD